MKSNKTIIIVVLAILISLACLVVWTMVKNVEYRRMIKETDLQIQKAETQQKARLQEAEAQRKSRLQEAEATELQEKNAKLQEQIKGPTSFVPFTGEETALTMVEAYPEKYIGKTFIVIGGIAVSDYYNWRYENAKGTHISFKFDELRPDKSRTGKNMSLYVKREISKNLVEEITKAVDTGYRSKLIRVKASILGNRYDPDCPGILAELIDWQFLSSDKKGWQDWASRKRR